MFTIFSCEKNLTIDSDLLLYDKVQIYLKDSINQMDLGRKNQFLKVISYSDEIKNDSIRNRSNLLIAYKLLQLGEDSLFNNLNQKVNILSKKTKDTFAIADTHWNYGHYYSKREKIDSAYYHYYQAYKYYLLIEHQNYKAKMLYNMAYLQSISRDYISSESKLIRAITIFKVLNKKKSLFDCYSLLGSIYAELEDFENSVKFHKKAMTYVENSESNIYLEKSLNDLGITYRKMGDFEKSFHSFNTAFLNKSIRDLDESFYAKIIDNYAYTRLLNNELTGVLDSLYIAQEIRKSTDDYSGLAMSKLHLSKFFEKIGDTQQALKYGKDALLISKLNGNNRDVLESLILLSRVDTNNSEEYLRRNLELSNNLQREQLKLSNKFARISFETDEYIDKTHKLSLQRIILIISSISVIFIISLIFSVRIQRVKNKKLELEKSQQEANQEIYRLLLDHQMKIEEGRLSERNRISEDLHDGVLGKIFGARINLGFLDFQAGKVEREKFNDLLEELQIIEREIREISHDLKSNSIFENNYIELLELLLKESSVIGSFNYEFNSPNPYKWNNLNNNVKVNIYRILQELLQNIIKHSNASLVKVLMKIEEKTYVVEIHDNGKGLIPNNNFVGIGHKNIKARIKKISAQLNITSNPGKGLSIIITIPNKS